MISILCYLPVVEIELTTSRWFHLEALFNQMPLSIAPCLLVDNSERIFGIYKPHVSIKPMRYHSPQLCMIFHLSSYHSFFLLNYFDFKKYLNFVFNLYVKQRYFFFCLLGLEYSKCIPCKEVRVPPSLQKKGVS